MQPLSCAQRRARQTTSFISLTSKTKTHAALAGQLGVFDAKSRFAAAAQEVHNFSVPLGLPLSPNNRPQASVWSRHGHRPAESL